MAKILVTGGAGYIGSHICKALSAAGHVPISYDNLSRGFRSSVLWGPLIEGSVHDSEKLEKVIEDHEIQAVIHLAAFAYAEESVHKPQLYFENNVYGSLILLETLIKKKIRNIVFSSSCAVYGESLSETIDENHPLNPINPYGLSKKITEAWIQKYGEMDHLDFVILRYFNAAGSDPDLEIGENHVPEPHIIPNLIKAALDNKPIKIFGDDYPTSDGTCVRDFIHATDLAQAHVIALNGLLEKVPGSFLEKKNQVPFNGLLLQKEPGTFYNLGNGRGYSLLELIQQAEETTQRKISIDWQPRRAGDPAKLVCNSEKFKHAFNFQLKHSNLNEIFETTLKWKTKNKSKLQ